MDRVIESKRLEKPQVLDLEAAKENQTLNSNEIEKWLNDKAATSSRARTIPKQVFVTATT